MSLSGKERRILAEIEQALEQDDPELARRVAAINKIESDGVPAQRTEDEPPRARDATPLPGDEPIQRAEPEPLIGERPGRRLARTWLIVVVVALTFLLLVLAVATA
jgi:hypothetical protein